MAEIVNLRRIRKARERLAAADEAASNRLRHGRTLAERQASGAQERLDRNQLDNAKLDRDGERRE